MSGKSPELDAIDEKLARELTPEKKQRATQAQIAAIIQKRNQGKPITNRDAGLLEEYEDCLELGGKPRHAVTGKILPRYYSTHKAAASALGLSIDTVSRAKAEGSVAFANSKIYLTKLALWCKENDIPWGKDALKKPKKSNIPTRKIPKGKELLDKGNLGAGKALTRLEQEEARAHALYVEAQEDPAAEEKKRSILHTAWLKCSRELLRYEAQLEAAKRDSGELLPRQEVVDACRAFLAWTRAGQSDALHNAAPLLAGAKTPVEAAAIWEGKVLESMTIALRNAHRAGLLPIWLADAAELPEPSKDERAEFYQEALEAVILSETSLSKTDRNHLARIAKKIKPQKT